MNSRSLTALVLLMTSVVGLAGGDNADAIEAARQDLARRLDVSLQQVTVVSRTAKDWPDASLGCPQPGMNYAQVLSSGVELVLSVDGRAYSYRARAGRSFKFCVKPTIRSPPPQGVQ